MSELLLPVPEDWQRAVAIAAHPDDLEYGTSSAVAKWTAAGKEVVYVLASRGEAGIDTLAPEECGPLREAEEREAGRLVGVDVVEFLGYQDGPSSMACRSVATWRGRSAAIDPMW